MRVLVVNNAVPFLRGGAEELADHLTAELNATPGVEAELMRLPFKWTPSERLVEEILIHRSLRLWNVDRVIGLKFPAYLVPHDHKTLWILHQFRQAYDLGDAGQGLGPDGRDGELRAAVRAADDACFADAGRLFVNSPVTQARLARYNGFTAEVLYPPLNGPGDFAGGGDYGDYVFAGGRLSPGKRQHLLIEALAHAGPKARLVVAGPPEGDYGQALEETVAALGLKDRVALHFGYHPRARIGDWVRHARACAYLPYDEDSLGYVSMEAFAAGRAVLTTTDAGGLLEMVNAQTGIVTEPAPEALGEGLRRLFEDPRLARRLGAAAAADWAARRLTWPATIERLLS